MRISYLPFLAMLICTPVAFASDPKPDEVEFFEQRIRPVLVQHCYECHNSAETAEAELSLDHRDALRRGGASGSVIADPPTNSLLLKVIRHEIDGVEMPEGGPKLSDEVIADFEKWLEMDAPDPRDNPPSDEELAASTSWEAIREKRKQWWSLQPIKRPEVPNIDGGSQPVDRFVRAKMSEAGLNPAPRANREVLARRLSLTLVGLPPTLEEVSRFVNDPATDAYEQYVDRLLQSPQFGERWARHWMDWIRYAESHGSEGDPMIFGASHYRDHLIRSLNADVPYDQMVREHIAGDLLESPRINKELEINESVVATAHWRMVFHGFAPTDALDEKVRFVDDAINVFSKMFLGLTVSCARCHDHKFDAISQADYYALFGVIGSARPGRAAIDVPERLNLNREELATLKREIRHAIASDWIESLPNIGDRLVAKTNESKDNRKTDSLARLYSELKEADNFAAAWSKRLSEISHRSDEPEVLQRWNLGTPGDHRKWFTYGNGTIDQVSSAGAYSLLHSGDQVVRSIYPAGVYSHLISDKHGAVLTSPQIQLDGQYDLWLRIHGGGTAISRYVVQDYPRNGTVYPVTELNDDQHARWHWQKYDLSYWDGDKMHIELATANDSTLLVKSQERSWFGIREAMIVPKDTPLPETHDRQWLQLLVDEAESASLVAVDEFVELVSRVIAASIDAWRRGDMSDSQALLLDQCIHEGLLPNSIDRLTNARPLVEQYRKIENEIPVARRVPALSEWVGSDQPLYERGNHKQPGELIPRRFLEAIDGTPYDTHLSGRRQLAEDVLREDNPLTARVIVNRVWHHLFGRGIVGTNDNFGRLGQVPTHPELLDFLADEFRHTDGWSIKSMIRRIVTSETWQQDSVPSEAALQSDPDNLFYSYHSVQRLEAEAIRDSMLAVSGRLDDSMFGDSVSGNSDRRSVYVEVIRNSLDPFLTTFDAPVPFSTVGRRDVTNVPAQALLMMNDPFVVQSAKRFADQVLSEKFLTDDTMRIRWMWQRAFGRQPTEHESQFAADYLSNAAQRIAVVQTASEALSAELKQLEIAKGRLFETARNRISGDAVATEKQIELSPIAQWSFDTTAKDGIGNLDLQLRGTAKIIDGALVLDGESWAESRPIEANLNEKTLEAIVQLDDLQQSGGGVMTIQDLRGENFDSIVFAERKAKHWLAGSNNHRRTQPFGGPAEEDAASRGVHLVITYANSGIVTCYRDGVQYGDSYKTDLQSFSAGDFQVVFGMRHGKSAGGNRMLHGRVLEARLYDRELTRDEVAAVASGQSNLISNDKVIAAMTDDERRQWESLQERSAALDAKRNDSMSKMDPNQPWVDLAHSIFNMKEFIYVR